MDSDNTSAATTEHGTATWFTTSSPADTTIWIKNFGVYVHFCALAVIIPVGLVCNAFSIGVFVTATKFRRTSTGQLLIALSAVDWLVLVGDALRWMTKMIQDDDKKYVYITGLSFYETSDFACKFVNICRYSTKLLSAWLTVVITLERLLAVALPLKVGRLSTPFRMRCIVAVLAVICLALSLFPLWTLNVEPLNDGLHCFYRLERQVEYDVWLWVVRRVGTLALPTALLVICSSLIIYFLARARHARPQSARGGSPAITQQMSKSKNTHKSTQRQLTIMLIAVCVAAVCLQLPYMILYLIFSRERSWWPGEEGSAKYAWIHAWKEIAEAVSVANYAVNFFLYCVSGSAFRRQVRTISRRVCRAHRRSLCDATVVTACASPYSRSTSPTIRFQVRQQNVDDHNDVVHLAD